MDEASQLMTMLLRQVLLRQEMYKFVYIRELGQLIVAKSRRLDPGKGAGRFAARSGRGGKKQPTKGRVPSRLSSRRRRHRSSSKD